MRSDFLETMLIILMVLLLVIHALSLGSITNKLQNNIEIRNKLIDYLAEKLEFSYHLFEADGEFDVYDEKLGVKQ